MTTVRTVIHDRRIEVPAPDDLPDGTEVVLTKNDIMIAAMALSLGNTAVVTMDSDLAAVPGLIAENWAEAV